MSYTPNNAWNSNPQTGLTSNPGPFLAEVMKNNDPLYSGRLLVYIPEFGGDPEQESSWHLVRYMSPYYGIQPLSNRLVGEPAEAIESYGMWMTPPDLGVKVLVMFINGDRSKGVWMGCLPEIGSHGSIPGNDKGDFDVFANQSLANNNIQDIPRPEHSTAPTFDEQGLGEDPQRGKTITTSSLRESPSKVFGMNTPSGHSFFMDDGAEDGTNKMLRLRTASGNMIMMNDDTGFVYIINAKGTGWIELSPSGFVDVYGEQGISIGTPGNIDMHASGNINMHAGQNIKMVADKEAKFQGTEKTKIYGGNLFLQGSDSLQMYSCGRIKLTGNAGLDFKSEKNFVLEGRIFKWNSGSAGEAEQVPPDSNFDITGYKSTVFRAPNREPWQGHEESYEETPKGKLIGPDLNLNNPLDAIGGGLGNSNILSGVANSNLSQLTQEINVLPEKLRQPAFENIGIGGNILEIEKSLKENIGVDRIDIGNISTIIGSGNNLGAALTSNIAQNINITGALSASNIVDTVFADTVLADNLGSIANTANQIGNIGNTIETINLKDLSLNGVLNNLDGVEQLSRQLNFSLPNSPLVESALSIKSNIRNAESLIGQLSTPLTSLSALASAPSFSGLSGLIESNIDADRLTRSLGEIVNVPGLNQITAPLAEFTNIPGALSDVIGNIPDPAGIVNTLTSGIPNLNNISENLSQIGNIGDIGSITDVVDNLPIGIPDNIANIVPPDVGDAFADASSSLGNLNQTQASTNIPATPGGGVAPFSAIGSDCTTPITRGPSTPSDTPSGTPEQQQQSSSGNSGNAYSGAPGNVVPPSELLNDPEWQAELANLKREFPELDERDLYKVIQGESRFNSTIVNKDSGATGFFQFIPSTARGLGTSTAEIQNMTPGQQLKVYRKYLGQFNYAGGPLGIMQAAPGTYSNLIRKFGGKYSNVPGNYEVYSVGSKAWTQNPGWRGPDGRITIDSINHYYGKQT